MVGAPGIVDVLIGIYGASAADSHSVVVQRPTRGNSPAPLATSTAVARLPEETRSTPAIEVNLLEVAHNDSKGSALE